MRRCSAFALAIALVIAACAPSTVPSGDQAPPPPKLVVLLIIDQWPEWKLEQERPYLHAGGFDRLLSEGTWRVGEHPSIATLTAPGHALLGGGMPTSESGILANEWWHRDLGRSLKSVEAEDGGVTAKWLRTNGLADLWWQQRAVSVSLKDRAAILPLGHAGMPIWFDAKHAVWKTLAAHAPAWLDAWNRDHPVSARLHEVWSIADPDVLAKLSGGPDDAPGEVGGHGFGATFPHDPSATPSPSEAVVMTPTGNDIVLETAVAAIDGEQLGAHAQPDLLVVSLSAHDYVGHQFGQESWEMWDLDRRLDRSLAGFLAALDAKVGAGTWSMLVTSDHGASPLPERAHGGRIKYGEIKAAANRAAVAELGEGAWIDDVRYPTIFLSAAARAVPAHDRDQAIKKIVLALRSVPGLERVERAEDFEGNCAARARDDRAICLGLDRERSGEVVYVPASGWVIEADDEPEATGHGSFHAYDREVPVIELAPGRTRHPPLAAPATGEKLPMTAVSRIVRTWGEPPSPCDPARRCMR